MIFNKHYEIQGKHAILAPSKSYWVNDDDTQFFTRYVNSFSTQIGTISHDEAAKRITYKKKFRKYDKNNMELALLAGGIPKIVVENMNFDLYFDNLMNYTNDAIEFGMLPEVGLKYSDYCFGHCDAISFDERQGFLRIHDLKTGSTPAHMEQLMDYEALFLLEYRMKPVDIKSELRIYQNGEILYHCPEPEEIQFFMDSNVHKDELIYSWSN